MSAEYVPLDHPGGGNSGGSSHRSGKMNIGKFLKSPVFLIGVGVVVVFILFKGRKSSAVQETSAPVDYPNPQNSVDTASQMQNMQSIIESEMGQMVSQAMADYGSTVSDQLNDISQQVTDLGQKSKDYTDQVTKQVTSQVTQIQQKNNDLQQTIEQQQHNAVVDYLEQQILDAKFNVKDAEAKHMTTAQQQKYWDQANNARARLKSMGVDLTSTDLKSGTSYDTANKAYQASKTAG